MLAAGEVNLRLAIDTPPPCAYIPPDKFCEPHNHRREQSVTGRMIKCRYRDFDSGEGDRRDGVSSRRRTVTSRPRRPDSAAGALSHNVFNVRAEEWRR